MKSAATFLVLLIGLATYADSAARWQDAKANKKVEDAENTIARFVNVGFTRRQAIELLIEIREAEVETIEAIDEEMDEVWYALDSIEERVSRLEASNRAGRPAP